VRILHLPDELSPALYMAGGCALPTSLHAVDQADIRLGETVLVLGAGLSSSCRRGASGGPARVRIGQNVWRVELATDLQTRTKGMSDRDEVPEGTGMLFVFSREEVVGFHMLDCRTPLDVAFISARRRILEIRTMTVEPDPANPKARYSSRYPVRYALEVAGGALGRAGVKIGDSVELLGAAKDAIKEAR